MDNAFVQFGPSHVAAIALSVLLPLALAALSRGRSRSARTICLFFAAGLIATWVLWYWLIAQRGWLSAATILPMQLCDWAVIASIVTLIHPNQRSYELAYFWTFAGTLQALVTPELY